MLAIEVERRESWTIVTVGDDVDLHTAGELRAALNATLDDSEGPLVLDLSGVRFLDSTTLSVLVGAHKRLRHRGFALQVVGAGESARRVLAVTGLDRVFRLHETRDDALAV